MRVWLTSILVLNGPNVCAGDGGSGAGGFGRDSGDEDISAARGASGTAVMVCRRRVASANRWAAERAPETPSKYASTSSAMSKGC